MSLKKKNKMNDIKITPEKGDIMINWNSSTPGDYWLALILDNFSPGNNIRIYWFHSSVRTLGYRYFQPYHSYIRWPLSENVGESYFNTIEKYLEYVNKSSIKLNKENK